MQKYSGKRIFPLFRGSSFFTSEIHHKVNPTITELAADLCVSKPSVSVIVDKLIQKGFVKKVQSADDKRTFYLHLTKSGRKCAIFNDSIHGRFAAKVKKILDGKEIDQLSFLLEKIIAKLG